MRNTTKKVLSVLLACLLIMSIATVALADGGTITVGTDSGKAGDDVVIPVTLNADGVTSGAFKLSYDSTVLTYKSAAKATFGADSTVDGSSAGVVKFAFANNDTAVAANTALITVTFTVKADAALGASSISIGYDAADEPHHVKAGGFFDVNGDPVAVEATAGSVTVEATTYTVTYNEGAHGSISEVDKTLTVTAGNTANIAANAKTVTADEGYTFLGWNTDPEAAVALEVAPTVNSNITLYAIYEENAPAFAKGDVNGDGKVNANDGYYLLKHASKPGSYPVAVSGDVNGDGKVNANDGYYLLKHASKPGSYPLA